MGKKMMRLQDKMGLLKWKEKSTKHDGERYKLAIPWTKHPGTCLLNNYSDVEEILHHIENQLSEKPKVCKAHEETINLYLKKGYIRQVDTRLKQEQYLMLQWRKTGYHWMIWYIRGQSSRKTCLMFWYGLEEMLLLLFVTSARCIFK